jgi:hypothetical protein
MDMTARLQLPLLAVAQAGKEMTVNEAMTAIDIAAQAVVEGEASSPPAGPVAGQCWLVGGTPTGAFAGRSGAIAAWTEGGWRFLAAIEGMSVWRRDLAVVVRRRGAGWENGDAVAPVSGGAVIDAEARAAIATIVARLRAAGITAA